jgi:hypothetical protein
MGSGILAPEKRTGMDATVTVLAEDENGWRLMSPGVGIEGFRGPEPGRENKVTWNAPSLPIGNPVRGYKAKAKV